MFPPPRSPRAKTHSQDDLLNMLNSAGKAGFEQESRLATGLEIERQNRRFRAGTADGHQLT